MRILLFTGKGGVGKTSVSAATALLSSKMGYKTMVMSTDAAHSLSDSLDMELTDEPVKIRENLWGYEINVQREIKDNWGAVQEYVKLFLSSQGIEDVVAEELSVYPGMDELFSLVKIKKYYDEQAYDVVVVDCAPTGEALRLLSFPEITKWYMKHVFNLERKAVKTVRPIAKYLVPMPIPADNVFASLESMYKKIDGFGDILTNNNVTSVRLVMNPEKMVIKETHRAFTFLCLFGISVDSVIVNKLLPDDIEDPYFSRWKEIHLEHLKTIEESFFPIPIFKSKLFDQELVGIPLLEQMGEDIYGTKDPTDIFYSEMPIKISKEDGRYELNLHLPFTDKEKVELYHRGDELVLKVGWYKRNISLPRALIDKKPIEAKYHQDILKIKFKGEENG